MNKTNNNTGDSSGRSPVSFGGKDFRLSFFWFLAAADEDLLRRCSVTEQYKQASIGAAVLLTTFAAILSGYFAFSLLVDNPMVALAIALFWGLIIFNLDRFMVGSLRKDERNRKLKELYVALPRILLASLIAVLISRPIEVKIFENQIDVEQITLSEEFRDSITVGRRADLQTELSLRDKIASERNDLSKKQSDCASNAPGYNDARISYESCMKDRNGLMLQREKYDADRNAVRRDQQYIVSIDMNGDGIITPNEENKLSQDGINKRADLQVKIEDLDRQIAALGCREKESAMNKICDDYRKTVGKQIAEANTRIVDLDSSSINKKGDLEALKTEATKKSRTALGDILGKLRVLESIKKKDDAMFWASWLIMLLFFILETAPLFVKVLADRGAYDSLLMLKEQEVIFDTTTELKERESDANRRLAILEDIDGTLQETEKKIHHELMKDILEKQGALAQKIVTKWEEAEVSKLDNNTEEYLSNIIKTK